MTCHLPTFIFNSLCQNLYKGIFNIPPLYIDFMNCNVATPFEIIYCKNFKHFRSSFLKSRTQIAGANRLELNTALYQTAE